jgi:hypothetical protein
MSAPKSLETALSLLKEGGAIAPPAVDELVSVIRSGEAFLINPTETGPRAAARSMHWPPAFIIEWGYDVEFERAAQFHRWLQDNEPLLTTCMPQGVIYLGTYAVFAQSEQSLGAYRTVWGFATFEAMQAMGGAQGVAGYSDFNRLLNELISFRDHRIGAGRSQQMYQPAGSARRI